MNKRCFAFCLAVLLLSLFGGCAEHSGQATSSHNLHGQDSVQALNLPGEEFLRTELFFGTSIAATSEHPAGVVSEAQWADFVEEWVTPRFPYGLTVVEGYGQWLGEDGTIARERTKVLVLLTPSSSPDDWAEADKSIEEIRVAYCRMFHQEAVMRVTGRAKVAF